MIFECSICSGEIEAPDEFSDAHVLCPNCGREIIVPHLDLEFGIDERPGLDPEAYVAPASGPITPEEFRAQMEARRTRGKLVTGLVLAAVFLAAAAVFLFFVPPSAILEFASGVSEKKSFQRLYASAGLAPLGSYRAEILPGLRGETEEGRGWQTGEEGKTYLVVDTAAAPRYFPPTDEGYERIRQEAERHKVMDPKRTVPPRERCRFFDPNRFQLVMKDVPAVRGVLISINYGEYKGFYDAFSYIAPEGAPGMAGDERAKDMGNAMRLSVAFVVPSTGIDPGELWIQLDGMNSLKVPAADSREVALPR